MKKLTETYKIYRELPLFKVKKDVNIQMSD